MGSLQEALLQLEDYTPSKPITSPSTKPAMTTRYTDAEWARFFKEVESDVVVSEDPRQYPAIGSREFYATIDHTLLKLDAKGTQIDDLCSEARVNRFATVCVRPQFVHRAAVDLKGSGVRVASVIGFHEGTYDLLHKMHETKLSLDTGADELDVVINYPALIKGKYSDIFNELATLRLQAPPPTLLKVILETSQLDHSQIVAACTLAAAANFDFVKTSSGFNGHGATVEHVRLMAACCDQLAIASRDGKKMKVKASGGVRTLDDAVAMLAAGASRLGTSAGVWIAKEAQRQNAERSASPEDKEVVNGERPGMQTRLFTDY